MDRPPFDSKQSPFKSPISDYLGQARAPPLSTTGSPHRTDFQRFLEQQQQLHQGHLMNDLSLFLRQQQQQHLPHLQQSLLRDAAPVGSSGGFDATFLLRQQEEHVLASQLIARQRQVDDLLAGRTAQFTHSTTLTDHLLREQLLAQQYSSSFLTALQGAPIDHSLPALPPINAVVRDDTLRNQEHLEPDRKKEATTDEGDDDAQNDEEDPTNDTFPFKLFRMLSEAVDDGNDSIISFLPHGRAFAIHKPREFVAEIMPKYFTTGRMSSFQRQLNLYGFRRVTEGRDKGSYFHEHFAKGRRGSCRKIKRKKSNVRAPPNFFPPPSPGIELGQALSVRQLIADGYLNQGSRNFAQFGQHLGAGAGSMNHALAAALSLEQQRQNQQTDLLQQLLLRQQQEQLMLEEQTRRGGNERR